MKDKAARFQNTAARMGASAEAINEYLAGGKTNQPSCSATHKRSIIVAALIGLGYIAREIVRSGFPSSIGIIIYVLFCILLIAGKLLFGRMVGTYYIGTGIHVPSVRRPMWGAGIVVGWILLALPAILTIWHSIRTKQ